MSKKEKDTQKERVQQRDHNFWLIAMPTTKWIIIIELHVVVELKDYKMLSFAAVRQLAESRTRVPCQYHRDKHTGGRRRCCRGVRTRGAVAWAWSFENGSERAKERERNKETRRKSEGRGKVPALPNHPTPSSRP